MALHVLGAAALFVAAFPAATPLAAQAPRWELDLSGSRIRYDSLATLTAPAATGLVEWRRPALFGRISAGATSFQDAGWTLQGSGDLSRRLSLAGPTSLFHLELAAGGAASRHSSGFEASMARGDVRAHAGSRSGGGWLGIGLAYARTSIDSSAVRSVVPSVGVWGRKGALQGAIGYRRPVLFEHAFHETHATLGYSGERLDLTAFVGFRRSPPELGMSHDTWAGATAAVWLHSNAALLISGGRYPSDVLQGLPGGDQLTIGFRLTRSRVRPLPEAVVRAPLVYTEVEASAGGIVFDIQGARTVEVAGDWNGWDPEPLSRDGSAGWLLRSDLEPGIHRFNLLVDGERWIVPDGFPSIDDGFGGEVGLLIVAEGS